MTRSTLLTAALMLGIQIGWQEFRKGETEYILQLDEGVIAALRSGEPITSDIPPQLRNVTRIRIQMGTGELAQPQLSYFGDQDSERNAANGGASTERNGTSGSPSGNPADLSEDSSGWATRIGRNQYSNDQPPNVPPLLQQRGNGSSGDQLDLQPPTRVPASANENNLANENNYSRGNSSYPYRDEPPYSSNGNGQPEYNGRGGASPIEDPYAGSISGIDPLDDPLPGIRYPSDGSGYGNSLYLPGPAGSFGLGGSSQNQQNRQTLTGDDGFSLPKPKLGEHLPGYTSGGLAPWMNDERGRQEFDSTGGSDQPAGRGRSPQRPGNLDETAGNAGRSNSGAEERKVTQANRSRDLANDDTSEDEDEDGSAGDRVRRDQQSDSGLVTSRNANDPWLWTLFLLCLSLGANIYLVWIARGAYLRYRELADAQRRASFERMMLE